MINEKIVIEDKTADYNEAYIETYFWQESEELYLGQKRPAIVICPGGAYGMTSDREAEAIAVRFMGMGYHAVVLRYSVAPARYPVALRQLAKTVALLRKNSEKWHIEKDKIIVSGFSAGGHLAASLGKHRIDIAVVAVGVGLQVVLRIILVEQAVEFVAHAFGKIYHFLISLCIGHSDFFVVVGLRLHRARATEYHCDHQ